MENKSTTQLNELAKEIHKNAISKGFWDEPSEMGTLLMLVTSELGEALEADRKGRYAKEPSLDLLGTVSECYFDSSFKNNIKDTFEDEIADAIIRLLDICARFNIDIQKHIELKMRYNSTRERLHGKKY